MDNVKQWFIMFCVITVLSGLMETVIPKSSVKKSYGFLVTVILVYCLSSLFTGVNKADFKLNFFDEKKEDYSEIFEEKNKSTAQMATEEGYRKAIAQKLTTEGIAYEYICVEIEYSEETPFLSTLEVHTQNEDISEKEIINALDGYITDESKVYVIN